MSVWKGRWAISRPLPKKSGASGPPPVPMMTSTPSFLSCFARDRTWVSVPPIFNLLTNIKTVKDTLLTSIRSCPSICWGECVRPGRLVSEKGLPSSNGLYHNLGKRKLGFGREFPPCVEYMVLGKGNSIRVGKSRNLIRDYLAGFHK